MIIIVWKIRISFTRGCINNIICSNVLFYKNISIFSKVNFQPRFSKIFSVFFLQLRINTITWCVFKNDKFKRCCFEVEYVNDVSYMYASFPMQNIEVFFWPNIWLLKPWQLRKFWIYTITEKLHSSTTIQNPEEF